MTVRLPSRYEDLEPAFRGRLKPNRSLLSLVDQAFKSIEVSGGIRFLPIFGESGSGKTSAALEIGTHLPGVYVQQLPRNAIEDSSLLTSTLRQMDHEANGRKKVAVIDQYEEVAAQKSAIPSTFVETLSLLDRNHEFRNIIFIWLTTSKDFQASLAAATTRNRRILMSSDFEIQSIPKNEWSSIIEETFQFHNQDRPLADFEIINTDLFEIVRQHPTIGSSIEEVGGRLFKYITSLHDLSDYQVVMLWPVTDGLRISRIQQFTDARQGYKLDWASWYRQLNQDDQNSLPLREYNRARLYFDVRLVPIAAADLHQLCRELENENFQPAASYLNRLEQTHLFSVITNAWNPDTFTPLRERDSKRAEQARDWYAGVTTQPTLIGRRIAKCLTILGVTARHEVTIDSQFSSVRADVFVERQGTSQNKVIVEIKAFAPENTMPSSICDAVRVTLKRHAQFAGFLQRQ